MTDLARVPSPEDFVVHCKQCLREWILCQLPLRADEFAALAKLPCPRCRSKRVFFGALRKPVADGDAVGWLSSGDTGLSSLTIWGVMMDRPAERPYVPVDPADFGRCYRLLCIMPSWRPRLREVAERYPVWAPLVDHWAQIEALYLKELPSGSAPRCYALMTRLLGRSRG